LGRSHGTVFRITDDLFSILDKPKSSFEAFPEPSQAFSKPFRTVSWPEAHRNTSKPSSIYINVPYQVLLSLTSVPLLVVGLLSLLVWTLSFSLAPRRKEDRALLRTYQVLMLTNTALMGAYFIGMNAWIPTGTASRVLLALVSVFPPIIVSFVRHLRRRAVRSSEPVLWLLSTAMIVASTLDSTRTTSSLIPAPGWLLVPYAVLVGLSLFFSLREVVQHGAKRDSLHARQLVLTGTLLMVFSGADFINVSFNLGWPPLAWMGSLAMTLAFSNAIIRNYRHAIRTLEIVERERSDLQERLAHDELTGLYTRAHGMERLKQALKSGSACVVFIDLDDFKSWNDRHSHAVGDHVLREVARIVRTSARSEDVAARYAGDEFFVVLPGARLEAGLRVAETIRRNLGGLEIESEPVTASFGVARGGPQDSAAGVIDRADRAAYQAKRDGKNRIKHPTMTMA
jgi:diguanylate cyclase (GGDEF)-like protein